MLQPMTNIVVTNLVDFGSAPQTAGQEIAGIVRDMFTPQTWAGKIFYAVLVAFVTWLVGRAVHLAVHRVLDRDTHGALDRTTISFLARVARLLVYIFGFVSYAHIIPGLQHLGTAYLASAGVLSVVVGLAAQSTLGNLIAGISLVLYRPFKLGDQLQVTAPTGLETGFVESINLGYTILRTDDNRQLVLPNSLIANQTSINLSLTRPNCVLTFKLSYDADVDKARKILLDLGNRHPNSTGTSDCRLTALIPSGVTLTLTTPPKDASKIAQMTWDILESAKKQFDAAGIPFQRDDGATRR
jgi:small conductance mechanosensitive channel